MGHYYPWASPTYLLNEMSMPQILMYYDYLVGDITGKPSGPNKDKPNRRKFHKTYGDKIKRPNRSSAR